MIGMYQNLKNKKYYYVYRTSTNTDNSKTFVQFYQIKSFENSKKVNKDKYYTEVMSVFLSSHAFQEDLPPPIPT